MIEVNERVPRISERRQRLELDKFAFRFGLKPLKQF